MVLIDTNVAVSLWIENDWTDAARRLFAKDSGWSTEAYALVEFSNVMATYVRNDLSSFADAHKRLREAEQLLSPGLIEIEHGAALRAAIDYGTSAYDARFLAAARELDVRLVTEDAKLRRAAPELTQSIDQALA